MLGLMSNRACNPQLFFIIIICHDIKYLIGNFIKYFFGQFGVLNQINRRSKMLNQSEVNQTINVIL